ncbi:MAG: alpha-glucosidase/alpha-galactosidase, partial [Candidatus Marinimicrobia bacterium]|nr:alpha-glucosidase/alpha-galactosidase [Candidatus Neomarinimicrobiota bacterium]
MNRPKIAMIGGGSFAWMPRLLCDVMLTPELADADIRLLDLVAERAELVAAGARRTAARIGAGATFTPTTDP